MRAVVLAIVALVPTVGRADAVEDAAQVHLDRGVAAFERGDYPAAHRELLAANQLVPTKPNPYRWLALTEVQLGDCARARVNIEAFLGRVTPEDPRRAEMLRLRELCERTGTLAIRTTPPKATLRIDGAHVGTAPYRSGSIAIGAHTVRAEHPGFAPLARAIELPAGGELELHLELRRPRPSLVRRWWFVPAVVGTAALITGAIVLGTRGDDGEALLPPITCDAAGCRPGGA